MVDDQETHKVGKVLPEALCFPEGFPCSLAQVFFMVKILPTKRRRLIAVQACKGTHRKAERRGIDRGILCCSRFVYRL